MDLDAMAAWPSAISADPGVPEELAPHGRSSVRQRSGTRPVELARLPDLVAGIPRILAADVD